MPRDLLERWAAVKAIRTPPVTAVAENECTPAATMDAKGAEAQKLIAAGERLAEVVKKLHCRRIAQLRLGNKHTAAALQDIITFAEGDDA